MADTTVVPPSEGKAKDFISLPIGAVVGRYTITAVLGQGAFGITYQARDDQLDRNVAIKEYLPAAFAARHNGLSVLPNSTKSADDFAWGRQRFVDEGRTLASFQQAAGIVHVYDFLEANGTAYMVMEQVRGETLEQRLRRAGPLSPADVDRILRPLLEGLAKVHEAGFVHRDIKPANILLDGERNPTLIDFGAARAALAGRTATMTAVFSPGYAAVEQFTNARQGPWTDIYGLSATLYHGISGKMPPSAIDRMVEDRCVPLATLAPAGFGPALLAGIDRGMTIRVAGRPQSIAEWHAILFAKASVRPVASPRRRVAVYAFGAVAALVMVAAAGLYALQGRGPTAQPRQTETAATDKSGAEQEVQRKAEAEQQQLQEQQRQQEEAAARQRAAQEAEREAARRQTEEVAAARLKAEEEARQQAAIEQAEREKAEQDTHDKAAAEEAARRQAVDDAAKRARAELEQARKSAEAGEAALRLAPLDRQRLQVALTSLGFDTHGADGVFGPRSREMVAAWQKARNLPPTGFLDAAHQQSLLKEAASAVGKFDDEQSRIVEDRKKAEEDAKRTAEVAGRWYGVIEGYNNGEARRILNIAFSANTMACTWDQVGKDKDLVVACSREGNRLNLVTAAHANVVLHLEKGVLTGSFTPRNGQAFAISMERTPPSNGLGGWDTATGEEAQRKAQQTAAAASPIAGRWYGVIRNYTAGEPRRLLAVTITASGPVCTWDEVSKTNGYPAKCTIDANRLDILTGPGSRVALTLNGEVLAGSFTLKDGRSFTLSMGRAAAEPAPKPNQPGTAAVTETGGVLEGSYSGGFNAPGEMVGSSGISFVFRVNVEVVNGRGSGAISTSSNNAQQQPNPLFIKIEADGQISGQGQATTFTGLTIPLQVRGRAEGNRLQLELTGFRIPVAVTLLKK